VEFIANQDGSFYFMEMNTRLQVEHPVTEMITGLDLVEWQLRVAAGERLPLRQEQLQLNGHALEARIYAENPEKGFLPSIGTLRYLHTPPAVNFRVDRLDSHMQTPAAVRIDSGVREGDAISPFYDPMIAKLIVWGKDREAALADMAAALAQYRIVGLATNIGFLQRLIAGQAFSTADLDTGLIERNHDQLFPAVQPASTATLALATSLLLAQEADRIGDARDPWAYTSGWRMNGSLLRALQFADEAGAYRIDVEYRSEKQWILHRDGVQHALHFERQGDTDLRVTLDDQIIAGNVVRDGDIFHAFHQSRHAVLTWDDPLAHAGQVENEGGRLTAPMPGKIVAVLVGKGDSVTKGAPLLIMEAMKMEHTIAAPADGVIDELLYAVGDQVTEGAQLLAFTPG
jgi:3-methylcrotonyl-CoA carboxylase alpha subunit